MREDHILECNYREGPLYGPGCICPPFGSSACSGADAREADKADSLPFPIGTLLQMLPDGKIVAVEAGVADARDPSEYE